MKTLTFITIVYLALATQNLAQAQDQSQPQHETQQVYLHGFRAPSTGAEYRLGNWGVHGGLYTTILDSGGKSTEFVKLGGTFYYKWSKAESFSRFENYLSIAAMRGLNRDYDKKNAGFIESGVLYRLGKGFEVRFGTGLLVAKGFRPEINPTIGLSYSIPLPKSK